MWGERSLPRDQSCSSSQIRPPHCLFVGVRRTFPGARVMITVVIVPQSSVGLLYEDGAFSKVLAPGRYRLGKRWFDKVKREVTLVDIRERSLTIKGQEILT